MELNTETPLHLIDGPILIRLGSAAVIGLLLGIDREVRGHAAGMRTHGLLCFSSALMTVCAITLHNQLGTERGNVDPLRVIEAAAAFSGIIAAGLIVFSKGEIRNLTTAAHIWLASVIGVACGAALWPLVVSAVIVAVVMMTLLRIVEDRWLDPEKRRR